MGNAADHGLDVPGITRTPPRELDAAARVIWTALARDLDRLTELLAEIEDHKDWLREHLGLGAFAVDGKKAFDIVEQRRWSEERAREVLPDDVIAQLEITTLSAHAAGELLSKETYRRCQVAHGRHRVVPVRDRGKVR